MDRSLVLVTGGCGHALQGFEVEQFVHASTMLVHAPTRPGVPIGEDAALGPKWPYPCSKAQAEEVVRQERGAIPALSCASPASIPTRARCRP